MENPSFQRPEDLLETDPAVLEGWMKTLSEKDQRDLGGYLQKLELILRESEQRKLSKSILYYQPIHRFQLEAHEALHRCRYIVLTWGNQAGKTYWATAVAVMYALGYEPFTGRHLRTPPSQIMIAGNDFVHAIAGDILPYLLEMIPSDELADPPFEYIHSGIISKIKFKNGSFIQFFSYEQPAKKYEGYRWDLEIFNEPPDRDIWIACKRGLMARSGKAIFACTLLSQPWMHRELVKLCGHDPEYFTNTATIYDNITIGEKERNSFIKGLRPEEKRARVYGEPLFLMGRVFEQYQPMVHRVPRSKFLVPDPDIPNKQIDLLAEWPKACVIDPHNQKPFAIGWYAVSPQGDYIAVDEFPRENFYEYKEQMTLKEYIQVIQDIEAGLPGGAEKVLWRYMDPNFGAHRIISSGYKVEEEFANFGYSFFTDFSNDIPPSVQLIKSRLSYNTKKPIGDTNRPSLYILDTLHNHNEAFMEWQYDETATSGERYKEEWKDYIDLVRYLVINGPVYYDPQEELEARRIHLQRMDSARL